MKILITYASAGSGHKQAAESLFDYFQENCRDSEIKLIDALQKTNFLFKNLYILGYRFLIHNALLIWQLGFWLTALRCLRRINGALAFIIYQLNARNLFRFIIQENPDFIISTHFLPSDVSAYLKKTKKISAKIVTIITDFGVHPFWIADGTDLYVVASEFTKQRLISEGVDKEKIREFGIPIEQKFLKKYDKEALAVKLNLKKDKFTVLIVTGSFGIGPIDEVIKLLYMDAQILAVCGNNRKLYARLNKLTYPNLKVYGYIDNMQELMFASDIIIAKPGGLSIAEILAAELPPIFISPIPGQETKNLEVMQRYKIGSRPKRLEDIKKIVLDYKEHPDKLNKVKENIKAIKKPLATQELCNALCYYVN